MMRNFALTFATVTLQIYLSLFLVADVQYADDYPTTAWLAWVPNLILVEWYLAIKGTGLAHQ